MLLSSNLNSGKLQCRNALWQLRVSALFAFSRLFVSWQSAAVLRVQAKATSAECLEAGVSLQPD